MTSSEIFDIEYEFRNRADTKVMIERLGITMSDNETPKIVEARSHYWYPGPSYQATLSSRMNTKVRKIFGETIQCQDWHILNAFKPYWIHSDSYCDSDPIATSIPADMDYSWTFLIPLDDYNTNTIVFNEQSRDTKIPTVWISRTDQKKQYAITDDTYYQYLSHLQRDIVDYFSIDTIFPWKKGDLLAMSRHAFHCSDNFTVKKILEKRAIIGWSFTPKT